MFFCAWIDAADAAIGDYTCANEARCRSVCRSGNYLLNDSSFAITPYYCVYDGYVPGSLLEGEYCFTQQDCREGFFCRKEIGRDVCRQKYPDGLHCVSGGISVDLDNCTNGCSSGRYYNSVADSESGAVVFTCGDPRSTASPAPTGTPGPQMTDRLVPGETTDTSGIIKCGRPGQNMCTLCDLVKGINDIVQFLMKVSIGIALLAITIGGILYIISSGDSGMMDKAKSAIKNALIGFIVVFSAYLIINTTIVYLGTKADLGISAHWGTFDCNRTVQ
ncbi:MAG TPA: pilin [Candidatus Moranbacteria bacterium]|nr:pilin [Candidatus Moranbacteria bacterium]